MSLSHLLGPENKKKLKELRRKAKGNRRDLKGLPMPKSGTITMIEIIITH